MCLEEVCANGRCEVILGFSDARLSVLKRGGEEVIAQATLADYIGQGVCPKILRYVPDGYEMEILEPAPHRTVIQLAEVLQRLRTMVWSRNERDSGASTSQWLGALRKWCERNALYLLESVDRIYPTEPTEGYSLIHGDPALSNLMLRGTYLIITDPMPRLDYRIEIPNRPEVDTGKLLQSACGWERMLGCESSMWNEPERLLTMLPEEMRAPTVLWGAIHLARITVRARISSNQRIEEWSRAQSRMLLRAFL